MLRERYTLVFPPGSSSKPITYYLIKKYDIEVNILKGEINVGKEGRLLVEFKGLEEDIQAGIAYLKKENISVIPLGKQINIALESCIHCGACTAVCFTNALQIDFESKKLDFEAIKCIACGLCVKACPLGLIVMNFGQERPV